MQGSDKCYVIFPPKLAPAFISCVHFLYLPHLCMFYLMSNSTISLLWLSMPSYLRLGTGHSCPCHGHKRKRTEGAGLLRGQNLKPVVAVSVIALSIRKNIPQTTSSGRGGHFLEEGPHFPAQAQYTPAHT